MRPRMSAAFHAVVAMGTNRVIGRGGKLPWHEPDDLRFFKQLTSGHPVIMGRRTWDSIGRPLPNRRNIVLSRTMAPVAGIEVVRTPEELATLGLQGDAFVIGGAEIYRELLPQCASVYVSKMNAAPEGDAFMPAFEADFPRAEKVAEFPNFTVWRHFRAV